MKRAMLAVVMLSLVFLLACESKTTGTRVAVDDIPLSKETASRTPTAAIAVETAALAETGKSAAETLKELQESPSTPIASGAKSGTFYPPVTTDKTGQEALKEKTRALFQQQTQTPSVDADDEFGARYHDDDGDATNLPDKYSDSSGD